MTSVIRFRPELQGAFERLNRQWIESLFRIEGSDEAQLSDPASTIIAPGGEIFFVVESLPAGDQVVGTCAMKPEGPPADRRYELAKMAVAPEAQGRGHANLLVRAALDWARERGAREVVLRTNSSLAPAVRLYEKHGFVVIRSGSGVGAEYGYSRGDLEMALTLSDE
jgi:ribosomal protein S18 acetylase RimI-like enzyme